MTGFASSQVTLPTGTLTATLRAVNGRNLDLHLYLSSELAAFENSVRALVKTKCSRGNIEVRLSFGSSARPASSALNSEQLASYVEAFREAATRLGLNSSPDLNHFLGLPGVIATNNLDKESKALIEERDALSALESCLDELNRFRQREGEQLARAIGEMGQEIEALSRQIQSIREQALPEFQTRLTERIRALLADSTIPVGRIVEEAALLTARSDIAEELTRLQVHNAELCRLLQEGGSVGKRLDFLLQEMQRETNTMLSKTSGVGQVGLTVTNLALGLKAKIEGIREQSLNLE